MRRGPLPVRRVVNVTGPAELQPASQSCTQDGKTTTVAFWSVASNGQRRLSIIAGTNASGDRHLAANATLTRFKAAA